MRNTHIVFLGNCQAGGMRHIVEHFVTPYEPITTHFIDAFAGDRPGAIEHLRRADIVVGQATSAPQPLGHEHIPSGVKTHLIPAVSGAFLYPYHGVLHPAGPVQRDGNTPYQPEYSDRYLAKLYNERVDPAEAVERYRAFDVAAAAKVGRLYELTLETQRGLDSITGYACAEIIEVYLQDERLFQSAFHFDGRIARHIGALLCDRLGFDAKYGQRVRDFLREGPFVRHHVPIHPSIATFFGLRWATDELRYPYRLEGAFTFNEYVERFMRCQWSRALQEGIEDARAGLPGAKQTLEVGLLEAPRSAEGAHEMSRVLEREGDMAGAIAMQQRATAMATRAHIPFRLGELLRKAGDAVGCELAFRRVLDIDPTNPHAWRMWRDALVALGRNAEAQRADRRASLYRIEKRSTQPQPVLSQASSVALPDHLELVAHVQNHGDMRSDVDGWVGRIGSGLAIEGFAILDDAAAAQVTFITYQALFSDGTMSESTRTGAYCGTRGQNKPIFGVLLSVADGAAKPVGVTVEASFVGCPEVETVSPGVMCQADIMMPLESLRIVVSA